jgi:hypothetical protein
LLKHHSSLLGTVQNTATVCLDPYAHMNRVSGLTHQDRITLLWHIDHSPTLPLRVRFERMKDRPKIQCIHRDHRQFTTEVRLLDPKKKAPAVK